MYLDSCGASICLKLSMLRVTETTVVYRANQIAIPTQIKNATVTGTLSDDFFLFNRENEIND